MINKLSTVSIWARSLSCFDASVWAALTAQSAEMVLEAGAKKGSALRVNDSTSW